MEAKGVYILLAQFMISSSIWLPLRLHPLRLGSARPQTFVSLVAGVLNRAEWFKFLGLFFNLDAVATNIFNNINESYYDTKASIEVAAEPPLMIFSDYYDYYDEFAYEVSLAAYKVQYTEVSCLCI